MAITGTSHERDKVKDKRRGGEQEGHGITKRAAQASAASPTARNSVK